jgi:hypothetical protein
MRLIVAAFPVMCFRCHARIDRCLESHPRFDGVKAASLGISERHTHVTIFDLAVAGLVPPDLDTAHDAKAWRVLEHDNLRHAADCRGRYLAF